MAPTRRFPKTVLVSLCLGIMQPVAAQAIELTGAWASQADLCKLVFKKQNKQTVFAAFSDLYGSGFIINGDQIKGKSAQCRIKSKKQQGDSLELLAACAAGVMILNVHFSLKVIDDNNVSRLFPETDGMTVKYTRCAM